MQYRFIAKKIGEGRSATWRVYDKQRGSYPYRTPELGVVLQDATQAEIEAEVERLHGAFGGIRETAAQRKARTKATEESTDVAPDDSSEGDADEDDAADDEADEA